MKTQTLRKSKSLEWYKRYFKQSGNILNKKQSTIISQVTSLKNYVCAS